MIAFHTLLSPLKYFHFLKLGFMNGSNTFLHATSSLPYSILGYNTRPHILIFDCDKTQEKSNFYTPPSNPIIPVLFPQPFNIALLHLHLIIAALEFLTQQGNFKYSKQHKKFTDYAYHLSMPLKKQKLFSVPAVSYESKLVEEHKFALKLSNTILNPQEH